MVTFWLVETLLFVGYPAMLPLGTMKVQTLLPGLLWICLVSMFVYNIPILNIISANIFLPLGKRIGMVQISTSFILSSRSWDISNRLTGGTFVIPVVEHRLEREKAQWVHHKRSTRQPIAPWSDEVPRSYLSLSIHLKFVRQTLCLIVSTVSVFCSSPHLGRVHSFCANK